MARRDRELGAAKGADGMRPGAGSMELDRLSPSAAEARREVELLGFYDRVRRRVLRAVERRGPRLGRRLVDTLLIVPDVLLLLVRLVLDPDVPRSSRAVIGGGLAYFLLPFDVVPEILVGAPGYVEDLLVASVVLACALGDDLEVYGQRYWSGPEDLRRVLGDIAASASRLVGADVERRLEKVLDRLLRRGGGEERPASS